MSVNPLKIDARNNTSWWRDDIEPAERIGRPSASICERKKLMLLEI